MPYEDPSHHPAVLAKRADRSSRIPLPWRLSEDVIKELSSRPRRAFLKPYKTAICPNIMSEDELDLTDPAKHDATSLLTLISEGDVTSVKLTTAFCKRAAIAHQLTNCFSEIMFAEALAAAGTVDQKWREHRAAGTPLPRLHGLPVTVKDSFHVQGWDSSIGIVALCNQPQRQNSAMVDILQSAGAIIIAKTTVPQTMLTADTDSIVFGRTCNAWRGDMGAGGSSGGEGVAVAMGSSALGIGTDGAGSVRMPAFVNGVIGLRTSGYRWPLDGVNIMGKGIMGITVLGPVPVAGPLCRSVRDASLILQVVSEVKPWIANPFVLPSPWLNIPPPSKQIRIGIWEDFDYVHLLPPVDRAFRNARTSLQSNPIPGIEFVLVPFKGPSIAEVWSFQKDWTQIQDIRILREWLSGESITDIVAAAGILNPPQGIPPFSLDYLHLMNQKIAALVYHMTAAWCSEEPIDALLWVPAPHPAVPFDEYLDMTFTSLFNVIDWPAITLPTGEVVDAAQGDFEVAHRVDEASLLSAEDKRIQELYFKDPSRFEGLPLSVQLIGRRGLDEELLGIAKVVHKAIRPSGLRT